MNKSVQTAWYKQFWPWFLISIPLVSVILSGTMLNLALTTENSMVVDDYYKEGKAINQQLDRIENARAKNIRTELITSGNAIALNFLSGKPNSGKAVKLIFSHATMASKDFDILLTMDASGTYRSIVQTPITGKWKVTLTPLSEEWKVSQPLSFPRSGAILFEP